jgi:hypothetical protein
MCADIDWSNGNKHEHISAKTWRLKSPDDRLIAARADLKAAGFEHEAEILNKGRLNTAWNKLSREVRAEHVKHRAEQTGAKKRQKKQTERVEGKYFLFCATLVNTKH